ncbi:DNA cytosine methyltransferase [Nocardia tengchongensis]|uniref:DNA methylase n=1 Tax=Nocardia tengchongensis TaxID=2055889 RepID=UPI003680BDFE
MTQRVLYDLPTWEAPELPDGPRPLLLDLFCCAGGAARGYDRAGFRVVGVDIAPQPNYPFEFHQGDALEFLATYRNRAAAVHASPPCQSSCTLTAGTNKGREYPQLIPATRAALADLDVPTVIENVQGAKVRRDVTLCGEMFGLGVIRHRYFELGGWTMPQPVHVPHRGRVAGYRHGRKYDGPYVAVYGNGGGKGSVAQWQSAMGIDWTSDRAELTEAIPPAYTEFLGRGLLSEVTRRAACNKTRCQAPGCGSLLTQPSTGRPRRFCSGACRVRHHRATRACIGLS